jgi:hypothetical protein
LPVLGHSISGKEVRHVDPGLKQRFRRSRRHTGR